MPTPDGRDWLTPAEIMRRVYDSLMEEFPAMEDYFNTSSKRTRFKEAVKRGWRRTGYQQEFKAARMFEKLKDALKRDQFESLEEVKAWVARVYTQAFMDGIDDDGNPIV